MDSKTMFELADRLKELREKKKSTESELKEINADIEKVDYDLSELMAETETQNFTRSGTMFCLTTTTRASVKEGNKDKLYIALRGEGFGNLIYETVNTNSLSAFIKEQIEENDDKLPKWLDGLVNVFEKTTVGVRKSNKQ
ncbi:MAG: gp33 family protein [Eubacteriales bacterium]